MKAETVNDWKGVLKYLYPNADAIYRCMVTFPVIVPVPVPSIRAVCAAVDKSKRLPFVESGPLQSNTP